CPSSRTAPALATPASGGGRLQRGFGPELDPEILDDRIGEKLVSHVFDPSSGMILVRLVHRDHEVLAGPYIFDRLEAEGVQTPADRETRGVVDNRLQRDDEFSSVHNSAHARFALRVAIVVWRARGGVGVRGY